MNIKKILYVYIYCNMGGVTSVLKQRARHMDEFDLNGLFQIEYGGKEELLKYGFGNVVIAENLLEALEGELRDNEYDLITIIDMPDILQQVLDWGYGDKVVYEIHTPMLDVLLKNNPVALAAAHHIVVPSVWSKNWVLRHFPTLAAKQISSCGNIVDPELFQSGTALDHNQKPKPGEKGSLVWVGKFGDYKNWREAIAIADEYLSDQRTAQAYFVTGGRLTDKVMNEALTEIGRTNSPERILWLHNLSYNEMAQLYRKAAACDGVFLSCSSAESFCMVIHEASRCGLPIVTTGAGAVTEFIEHDISGLIFDIAEPQSAAESLSLAVTNSKIRQRILSGAKKRLDSYTPKNLINDYISTIS